jgi:hypothetical protein
VVSEVCYNCHAGSSSSLASVVDAERVEYEDALAALAVQLDKKGISFAPAYPYMYKQRTNVGTVSVTNGSATVDGTGGMLWSSGTPSVILTDYFRAEVDGTAYAIAVVNSDTQITLAKPYAGPTAANVAYVIMKGTRSDGVKNWLFGGAEEDGRNTLGAALNFQLLEHEPGAYVHNSRYSKRLIYDAIDWIDDGVLNYSVGSQLNALSAVADYKAGAMLYLLPNGVMPGIAAERP